MQGQTLAGFETKSSAFVPKLLFRPQHSASPSSAHNPETRQYCCCNRASPTSVPRGGLFWQKSGVGRYGSRALPEQHPPRYTSQVGQKNTSSVSRGVLFWERPTSQNSTPRDYRSRVGHTEAEQHECTTTFSMAPHLIISLPLAASSCRGKRSGSG